MLGGGAGLESLPLWASQRGVAVRALRVLSEQGGVLLCLPTGFGKTYIACALAFVLWRADPSLRVVVLVPARLRVMWQRVAAGFGVPVEVCSHRDASLQRLPKASGATFWVVDEAHVFRHPSTLAYRALALSLRLGFACLLTATPVQTSPCDLLALLQLLPLVVPAATTVREAASRLLVQPEAGIEVVSGGFAIREHVWRPPPLAGEVGEALLSSLRGALPKAPLLLNLLLSRLSSHPTAWLQTVHRLVRALPSQSPVALRSVFRLDAPAQRLLPFGEALSEGVEASRLEGLLFPSPGLVEALRVLERQRLGTLDQELRALLGEPSPTRGGGCLIFSQFSDTASHVASGLRGLGWSAALITGREARLGPSRCDPASLLEAWCAKPSAQRPSPQVLVCTDVLAVGQNLERAQVLVHLDLPWNPATVLQRHGRVLRPGQGHDEVHFCYLCAPAPLDQWAERQQARVSERFRWVASLLSGGFLLLPEGPLHERLIAQREALVRGLVCAAFPFKHHASGAALLARIARLEQHLTLSPLCAGQSLALASLPLRGDLPPRLEAAEEALLINPK